MPPGVVLPPLLTPLKVWGDSVHPKVLCQWTPSTEGLVVLVGSAQLEGQLEERELMVGFATGKKLNVQHQFALISPLQME